MIVNDCLSYSDQLEFVHKLKLQSWSYTLSSGELDSRVCWQTPLDKELEPVVHSLVHTHIPGAWQITQTRGIAQTVRQPHILPETDPAQVEQLTLLYHPCITWDRQWHGATVIDGDRVEYTPNSLVAYARHLPVLHEAPQTENVLRMVVEIQLERRF